MNFGCGSIAWANSKSCATPIVATKTMTRGALNRRRMTNRSINQPTTPPTSTQTANAIQYGTSQLMTMRASSAAARPPISAIARLMTRVDR